ncbi:restriction endonuclease subunit S [Microbulbifer sp. ANSA003]|uniref:restriction endonuclease subunit S n=1 Tax=Microbulbifer sp. ANSA003 TaxID=3243360 RepID=UPI004042FCE2
MVNELYPTLPLEQLVTIHDKDRKPVTKSNRKPGPFPYYGASGITDYVDGYLFDGDYVLLAEDGDNLRTRNTPIAFMAKGKFWVNNHAHIIKAKGGESSDYICYALQVADIASYISGSTRPKITQADMKKIPISAPPKNVRDSISHVLGVLDDKIELNRETNQTLEKMAQALFKSWFVDFDPVIDNALAAGNPIPDALQARAQRRQQQLAKPDHKPLPEAIRQHFPCEFEHTEALGWVPKGWNPVTISQLCIKVQNGGTPKRSESVFWEKGTIPWLASGEVRQSIIYSTKNHITENGLKNSSAKLVPKETTVIAMYGATAGQVAFSTIEMTTNQAVCSLIPMKNSSYFIYLFMERLSSTLANQARGSAQQNISKGIIEATMVASPSPLVMKHFHDLLQPVFNGWEKNLLLNGSLEKLRDTLLPKLISGELRIPDVQKEVSDAVA